MKGNFIVYTFDIEHFQLNLFKKSKDLVYRNETEFKTIPNVLKVYNPFETTLCKYYINETGQVVSFYKILHTFSEDQLHQFYKNYDEKEDTDNTHKKVLKDIKNTFGTTIEPDSVSLLSVDKFEEEKIKWDHYRISSEKFPVFLECQFIFQLTKSFDKNLMNYQKNNNSYYRNKIMRNLSPSFFSITDPRSFILNDDEYKSFLVFYDEWKISDLCKTLNKKFSSVMVNSAHKNEKEKANQQNILNFFLLSITVLSTIRLIPVIDKIFPNSIDKKLFAQLIFIISIILFLILFFKPIKYVIREVYYRIKNFITLRQIKRNKI